jgi:RNA polymerase sigma factor (sigma-70 family)
MDDQDWLAERFEANRSHLRGVAFRMLGSVTEADDAVQEAWIRLSRTDASHVDDLRAWLTTVVGRVCLNLLRSRRTRREASLETLWGTETRSSRRTEGVRSPSAPLPRVRRRLCPA